MTINISSDANSASANAFRRSGHKGPIVAGLQTINAQLQEIHEDEDLTPLGKLLKQSIKNKTDKGVPFLLALYTTVYPFGVYNNRGTFDGQEEFEQIQNSNVGNILGVNVSINH
tara:strand:- start:1112 stop:1453 length:342 start_codon:yes stop_codon:yes gene_type:complete